jgi:hypothetical protein
MWISGNTSKKTSITITNPMVNYTPLVSCNLGSNHRNNHPPFPTLHHANVCKSTHGFTWLVTDHTATPLTHTTSEWHTQTINIWLPEYLCQMGPDWSTGWVSWLTVWALHLNLHTRVNEKSPFKLHSLHFHRDTQVGRQLKPWDSTQEKWKITASVLIQ